MARSNITLHLFQIEKPEWSQITEKRKEALAAILTSSKWRRINGLRQGFLNCRAEGDVLYGYFAQEGRIQVEQYDDAQQPIMDVEETESFERILFLFLLTPGILAVQSIRVARYIDLSGTQIRDSFFDSLETAFKQANLVFSGSAIFERYKQELTREQLIEAFQNNSIHRVKVSGLYGAKVPEKLKFFNPDFDKDAFLKSVIDEDLERTEQAELQGDELQNTRIARGLVHAGNPTLIEGTDEDGFDREWTPLTPQSISIELDVAAYSLPEEDAKRLLDHIGRTFGIFSERIRELRKRGDMGDLPLFDSQND